MTLERVAGGFEFTEGPVWSGDGALLFSSPNTNVIYRWHPSGRVSVFRSQVATPARTLALSQLARPASPSTRRAG